MINSIQATTSFSGLSSPYKIFLGLRPTTKGKHPFYKRLYHPFADESLEEINNALKHLNIYENFRHVVGKKLPITKNEFWEIIAGRGKIKTNYPERDFMTEQKTIPERLYKLWA